MIPDQLLRLAEAQSLNATAGATATATTNVVDIDTLRNLGAGTPLYVRIKFNAAYTQASGGANAAVVYADNTALTTNAVTLSLLPFVSTAIPAAGTVVYIPIPPIQRAISPTTGLPVAAVAGLPQSAVIPNTSKKYLGVTWSAYTTNITGTGTWTVDIVTETNLGEHAYPGGFAVT